MSVSVLPDRRNSSNYLAAVEAGSSGSTVDVESVPPALESLPSCSSSKEEEASDLKSPQKKRCYSSSESEKCLQSGSKRRTQRHNNGHKQRSKRRKLFNSPLENSSNPNKLTEPINAAASKTKPLPRVPLTQQPKAPNNTTQFLITDREERESSDRDTTAETSSADFSQLRPRCFSSACQNPNNIEAASFLLNSSDSDEEQEEEDSEFNLIYDNVSLERIQGLPREKVNREMLTTQKCNSQLVDKVTHLKTENIRLKSLLQQHGIEFKGNNAIPPPFPLSSFSRQARRSNSSSEGNSLVNLEDEEEAKREVLSPEET